MLVKCALAVAALAGQTVAATEPTLIRKPYQPQTLALMSVRKLLPGLDRRQQGVDGYTPEPEFCSNGNSCADACGKGYLECASDDGATHCFNQAANQKCCPGGTGNSCDDGYFCASDTKGAVWCCPDDMMLKECAASYNLPGGELVVPTQTAEPTQATTSTSDTTTAAPTSESSTTSTKSKTHSTKTTAENQESTTKKTDEPTAEPTNTTFKDDPAPSSATTTITTASPATTSSIREDVTTTDAGTAPTPAATEAPSDTGAASTPTSSGPPENGVAAIPRANDPRAMASLGVALVVALCGQLIW